MRTRVVMTAIVGALALGNQALAQVPAASGTASAVTGTVDVGARGTSSSGDEARYERYRDLRTGVFSHLVFGSADESRVWSAGADHVGYRNQEYVFRYAGGPVTLKGGLDIRHLHHRGNLGVQPADRMGRRLRRRNESHVVNDFKVVALFLKRRHRVHEREPRLIGNGERLETAALSPRIRDPGGHQHEVHLPRH